MSSAAPGRVFPPRLTPHHDVDLTLCELSFSTQCGGVQSATARRFHLAFREKREDFLGGVFSLKNT